MPKLAAVLTGDLVESGKAGAAAVERALDRLAQTADAIATWQPGAPPTRFTRFRGDGWQAVLSGAPALALRAAIVLRASLGAAGSETRIAIGFGSADSLGSRDLADAHGTAFERSGRALDALARQPRMALAAGGANLAFHRIILDLIDERLQRWTPEQAEAAALYLVPANPTLAEIGEWLGITPQAVGYRLAGAGATRLRKALADWEAAVDLAALGGP